jgi:hypothetical protein
LRAFLLSKFAAINYGFKIYSGQDAREHQCGLEVRGHQWHRRSSMPFGLSIDRLMATFGPLAAFFLFTQIWSDLLSLEQKQCFIFTSKNG